jgi:hypothetical protein
MVKSIVYDAAGRCAASKIRWKYTTFAKTKPRFEFHARRNASVFGESVKRETREMNERRENFSCSFFRVFRSFRVFRVLRFHQRLRAYGATIIKIDRFTPVPYKIEAY